MSTIQSSLFLALVVVAVLAPRAARDPFEYRPEGRRVVLYTVHRGGPETLKTAIKELFDQAKNMGVQPTGYLTLVSLNNATEARHRLTEVQISVDVDTSTIAPGTFPSAMTDIKEIPSRDVAVWKQGDETWTEGPEAPYRDLCRWIALRGDVPTFRQERRYRMDVYSDNYSQWLTEITVPFCKKDQFPNW